jgi:catechol 2,3-dioxygenase-like lactoylglutathione lyase family enzyme
MPQLIGQTPYLEVFDMTASVAFYRGLLGYEVVFASPEVETKEGRFSHFVILRRDKVEIMLNTAYDSNGRPSSRREARWSSTQHCRLFIDCDDVAGLYAEMNDRGLPADPPDRTGYGYLGFSVADPDGYMMTFHQPL